MGTPVLDSRGNGGHLTRIEEHTYWVFPGFLVSQGLWYKVFPTTLFWTRAHTIAWFALSLAALFWYLRKLLPESNVVPWLATMLFAGSFVAMDNAGFARPDIPCCALGLASMAAYVHLREKSLVNALFVANALVALSGLMHPNGIFHWIGLVALILWLDRKRLRLASLAAAIIPYAVLGGFWALYLMQDTQAVLDQLRGNSGDRWPGTWNPILILGREFMRYWQAYGLVTGGVNSLKLLGLILNWGAVAGCFLSRDLRNRDNVRFLLVQLGLYFLGLSVFNQKLTYYLIHIAPFYAILNAVFLTWLMEQGVRWGRLLPVAIALLIGVETGGIVLKAYTRSYVKAQRAAVKVVRSYARPGDRIYGSASLLYEMDFDSRLTDDAYLGTETGRVPNIIVIENLYRMLYEAWKIERPADMRIVMDRLAGYRMSYRQDGYEVWVEKDR